MGFRDNFIKTALKTTRERKNRNPLEEVKNNPYFTKMATYFSIEEKEELFDVCSRLYNDYPILKEYSITLLGVGAENTGDCVVKNKTALIRLGDCATIDTVVHELGHIVAKHSKLYKLDLDYANEYEVSVYALTSKEEMFCELIKNKYCSNDKFKVRVAQQILEGM